MEPKLTLTCLGEGPRGPKPIKSSKVCVMWHTLLALDLKAVDTMLDLSLPLFLTLTFFFFSKYILSLQTFKSLPSD